MVAEGRGLTAAATGLFLSEWQLVPARQLELL